VTYHRERDRALAVVGEIENGGGEAIATEFDLASAGSVSRAVGTALERWGQADVLVNVVMASATGTERMVARLPPRSSR
jgi:NAD(P)-dependent dehydrogenase (short-subunit alcohol dehydrogenase family)